MEERRLSNTGQGMRRQTDVVRVILQALFAKLDRNGMAAAMGTVFGLGLFLATAILLVNGAPSGISVGPHLAGLNTFLPGYTISWTGALVGGTYAALIGAAIGYGLAVLWNLAHYLFIGLALFRGNWLD